MKTSVFCSIGVSIIDVFLPLSNLLHSYPVCQAILLSVCAILAIIGIVLDVREFAKNKKGYVSKLVLESPIVYVISLMLGAILWYFTGIYLAMILWIAFAVLLLFSHYVKCKK